MADLADTIREAPQRKRDVNPNRRLTESAWQALSEALSTYCWFKDDFQTLVHAHFAEAPDALAVVNFNATKRMATGQLMRALRLKENQYQEVVIDALVALSQVSSTFPHLARLDNGSELVANAQAAHGAVRSVVQQYSDLAAQREAARREAESLAAKVSALRLHQDRLSHLREEFLKMHEMADEPHERGRMFERFLNSLFELWDLNPRAAYSIEHEQIDGAFTLRTDDYILEARWRSEPLQPKDLNDFRMKIDGKARNTLGLCVSIGGFTEGAITKHSGGQTPLVLMDGTDLLPVLEGRIALVEVLERKRRHAAETGNPMYRPWRNDTG